MSDGGRRGTHPCKVRRTASRYTVTSTGDSESPCGVPTFVFNVINPNGDVCLRQQKPYDLGVVCIKERMQNTQEFLSTDCIERT